MGNEPKSLNDRLGKNAAEPSRFLVLAELTPLPGHDLGNFERFLEAYGQNAGAIPGGFELAAVTIPQSPNGTASLSPADVYSILRMKGLWADLDVIPHVTAKDHNREAVQTYLFGLRKLGLRTILALTGDKPAAGPGVFDVDALGIIELAKELNFESFSRAVPGHFGETHQFYILAAVSPFKYSEASQRQQFMKMEKKIRSGADGLITQMGWDWRKSEELFRYLRERDLQVPVFGNVFLLSTTSPSARLMSEGKLPGCLVTQALWDRINRESLSDHIERAAQQVAMYRALGAAGVDLGGLWDFDLLVKILNRAAEIGGAWRQFQPNLEFGLASLPDGRPGFYFYPESGGPPASPARKKSAFRKKGFDFLHRTLLTPGRGLHPALKSVFGASRSLRLGRGFLYKLFLGWETGLKSMLFDCRECGDCYLVENFGYCTLGECAKGLPNPPCGDADTEGRCAHNPEKRCVGELIYDAAAGEGARGLARLAATSNASRRPDLDGSASLLNYLFQRDHSRPAGFIQIGENLHASIAKPAAAMKEILNMGAGAIDRPSGALDYLVSLIQAQVKHGADYIDVNVDAFDESDPDLSLRMIRDYVRLIRRHGRGIPVCIDSGSPDILKAGLEEWYKDAPSPVAVPLLNSVKTYTLDKLLPLRGRFPFKFIGLLVDIKSSGSEGSSYGIDELLGMARTIFRAATEVHGFKPGDIFFDSTVFPLAIDIPMNPGVPGYTYRTFETIRRIKNDPYFKGVHLSLGITNAVRDFPGRRTGVCRAYLALAREYGLDAAIVNVMHDYGQRPPAPDLLELIRIFAQQDGSADKSQRVVDRMMDFCRVNRKAGAKRPAATR